MAHWLERALLLVSDFLAINAATVVLLWMKFVGGGLTTVEKSWRLSHHDPASEPTFSYALKFYTDEALPLIFLCWLVLFIFLGMYRIERTQSRLDEAIAVFKVVTLGTLLFLIATMDSGVSFTRVLMGTYWLSLLGLVGGGRVALRSVQRRLIAAGVGRTRAVIVGSDARGERLLEDLVCRQSRVMRSPALCAPAPGRSARRSPACPCWETSTSWPTSSRSGMWRPC